MNQQTYDKLLRQDLNRVLLCLENMLNRKIEKRIKIADEPVSRRNISNLNYLDEDIASLRYVIINYIKSHLSHLKDFESEEKKINCLDKILLEFINQERNLTYGGLREYMEAIAIDPIDVDGPLFRSLIILVNEGFIKFDYKDVNSHSIIKVRRNSQRKINLILGLKK